MKKYLLLFLFTSVLSVTNAQYTWQNPLPSGNSLLDIQFVNSDYGFAVGKAGTILKTLNFGASWECHFYPDNSYDFQSVHFADVNNGAAITHDGVVVRTTDAGQTWIKQNIGLTKNLNSVFLSSTLREFIAADSGIILNSTDGGNTWTKKVLFYGIPDFTSLYFTNEYTGVVVGNSSTGATIFKTTDGGDSWEQKAIYLPQIASICFSDSNNGYAVGSNLVRSTNGGESWSIQGNTSGTKISFSDAKHGMILSGNSIYETNNGGINWQLLSTGTAHPIYCGYFVDSTRIIIAGENGVILNSRDDGASWQWACRGFFNAMVGVSFTDPTTGTVTGTDGLIFRTTNEGNTWTQQQSGTTVTLNDVFSITKNKILSVGEKGTILKTINGGTLWQKQIVDSTLSLKKAAFTDSLKGFIVGHSIMDSTGILLKTIDGGISWTPKKTFSTWLNDLSFINSNNIIVVGLKGLIQKTTDGGTSWIDESFDSTLILNAVAFRNSNLGFIAGSGEKIFKTTDGGNTWVLKHSSETGNTLLNHITIINDTNLISIGNHGRILRSSDIGETWYSEYSGSDNYLFSASFPSRNSGTIVGDGGAILHSSNITEIDEKNTFVIPDQFSLSANYPNPFNPTTKIRYSVPFESNLKIIVFDLLGREVRILVNERKRAGSYLAEFNGENLSSGVYFYRLETDQFVQTRKMLLIK